MKTSALFFALGLGAFPLGAQAAPVAMIGQAKGQVTISQGGKKSPAELLEHLEPGMTVTVGPNSSAIVVLFGNGDRFRIPAGTSATVGATNVAGGTKMAGMSGPSSKAVALLGNARIGAISSRPWVPYRRLQPNSPDFFLNPSPRFEWSAEPGAARYIFTLFDNRDDVVWGTSTDGTSLNYPADAPALNERTPYLWKLTCFSKSGKPLDKSYFGFVTILSAEDAQELNSQVAALKAQAEADAAADPTEKTSRLLLVAIYRSFGVINSALEVLDSMAYEEVDGATKLRNKVLDSLSPYSRVLTGRGVAAIESKPSL